MTRFLWCNRPPHRHGYDGNCNLASTPNVPDNLGYFDDFTYTYDVENRLVGQVFVNRSAGAPQTITTTLRYDPLGRLHEVAGSATGTTRFLYDGSDLVAEYNGEGTLLRRIVPGLGNGLHVGRHQAMTRSHRPGSGNLRQPNA